MIITETTIRTSVFAGTDHKFFDMVIQSRINASDKFQNHEPCFMKNYEPDMERDRR